MKTENKKLGYKFFWPYLCLCGLSALGNFNSYIKLALNSENFVYMIFNIYVALICLTFFISAALFVLSKWPSWVRLYKTAYYIHNVSIGLIIGYCLLCIFAACYNGDFVVAPVYLLYIGLYVLELMYFRKRKDAPPCIKQENITHINFL